MTEKNELYPRKCFWGKEVERGVYHTEYGDVITDKQITHGCVTCVVLFLGIVGFMTSCTMHVSDKVHRRFSRQELKKAPSMEQMVVQPDMQTNAVLVGLQGSQDRTK